MLPLLRRRRGDGPQAPKDASAEPHDDKWDHGSTDAEIFTVIKDDRAEWT
jgi:hypothetical protein